MPDYRVYCLNAEGHFSNSESIQARDDGEALTIARSIRRDVACELWNGPRFIARLPAMERASAE